MANAQGIFNWLVAHARVSFGLQIVGQTNQARLITHSQEQTEWMHRPPTELDSVSEDRDKALADWLARIALGDRTAFSSLYGVCAPRLFGTALRILGETAAAEEVLQEVFVEVWTKAHSYRTDLAAPMTWLRMITHRRAIDHRRRRTAAGGDCVDPTCDPDSLLAQTLAPDEAGELAQWSEHLRQCLDDLPVVQQEVISLLYVYGWSQQELAAHRGNPLGTIKSWARRGIEALRRCLDTLGDG